MHLYVIYPAIVAFGVIFLVLGLRNFRTQGAGLIELVRPSGRWTVLCRRRPDTVRHGRTGLTGPAGMHIRKHQVLWPLREK